MLTASGIPTSIDRIAQGQAATIYAQWEGADGQTFDPGTVAVTVTSDRTGQAILTSSSTVVSGFARAITLTPAQTASLDLLTLTWMSSDGTTLVSYAEIVGRFLFRVSAARVRTPLQDTTTYPSDQIVAYRTYAEMAIEDICGVSFVPRYSRDVARVGSWGALELPRRKVNNVIQITTTTNEGPQPVGNLTGLRIMPGGVVYMPGFYNWTSAPISIAYEHGYPYAPPRVTRAALELARRWLIESPWDERMTAFRSREGGEVDILTAKGDPFDIPEVVAVAELYGLPLVA